MSPKKYYWKSQVSSLSSASQKSWRKLGNSLTLPKSWLFSPQLLDSWWKRKPCMWSQTWTTASQCACTKPLKSTRAQKYGRNAQMRNNTDPCPVPIPAAKKKNKIYWPENWVIHYLLSYPHLSTEELSCAIHSLSRLPWRWHLDVVVTWMSKFILLGSCNVRESHWLVVWLGF